jgi:putative addiction module killer protein
VTEILRTDEFDTWLSHLRDREARARVLVRIARLALGNPGDTKPVGGGVSELRVTYGPGYRLYFTQAERGIVVLLVGGDKSSQDRDIAKARELAAGLKGGG